MQKNFNFWKAVIGKLPAFIRCSPFAFHPKQAYLSAMSETNVPFLKMNGLGNKIIVADLRSSARRVTGEAAQKIAENPATHFDQLMEITDASEDSLDANIRIFNSDGSTAGACGNGMRCVVTHMADGGDQKDFLFRTAAGLLPANLKDDGQVTVDMGSPRFRWDEIPLEEEFHDTTGIELQIGPIDAPVLHTPSVANMGNPHAVFWVDGDVKDYDLERFGPLLENHPIFPDRANITVAKVVSPEHIVIRTWERGAGITLACGSAACAALVCAHRKGLTGRKATVTVPGGDLQIEWTDKNRVLMTGPAEYEFSGLFNPETGETILESVEAG